MPARRPTQAQIRDRRAKITAVVLGVAFLGVAVIQGPKLLKMIQGGGSSSSSAASTTTTGETTPGSTTPGTTTAVVGVSAGPGQLSRFSLFPVQVPFKAPPKVASETGATTGKTTTTTATTPKPANATPAGGAATTTSTTPAAPPAPTTTTPAPPVTFTVPNGVAAAVVTVNGKKQLFGAGAEFPQEAPLFKLTAIAKQGLKIGVLGGSFVDGEHYLVLRQGNKVTLLNQSDGTKFVIKYVKKTFAPADQLTSPTATSTTATTPSAPTTTTR